MNYIVSLHCRIDAQNAEEARSQALAKILIRETSPLILTPLNVYERLREFRNKQKEYFITFLLDTQNNLLNFEIISLGTLDTSLIHPREVFRPAIIANCASVIVVHNHPSGGLEPSAEDLQVTKRLVNSGRLIGIEVVDHIIISKNGYFSLREHNLL